MGKNRYGLSKNNACKKYKAGIYLRISIDDNNNSESNSITNQRSFINDWINRSDDVQFVSEYVDDGYTGTNFNRPAFMKMMKDIAGNKIDSVIVKDVSRIGRNYIEVSNYIENIFPMYNIRFISIMDKIDSLSKPKSISNIYFSLKNIMNEQYSRDISKKAYSSKIARRKMGLYAGSIIPYGYKASEEGIKKWIIDENSSKVVKYIFNEYKNGLGYTKIAYNLNERGILCPSRYLVEVLGCKYGNSSCDSNSVSNNYWGIKNVKEILSNEAYCGDMIQGKFRKASYKQKELIKLPKDEWIVVKNTHEPIISRELFDEVQRIISSKRVETKRYNPNIFKGLLRCGDCHRSMIRKYTGQRKSNPEIANYTYYCMTYSRISRKLCTLHRTKGEDLEKIVLSAINNQIKLYINLRNIITDIKNSNNDVFKINEIEREINSYKIKLEKCMKRKLNLYEQYKTGSLSLTYYNYLYNKNIENVKNVKDKLDDFSIKYEKIKNNINDLSWIEELTANPIITNLDNDIMKKFINYIYVYEDYRVEICFKYDDKYKKILEYLKG